MHKSNKNYKQILVDKDNCNTLKELEKTGDSFNDIIRSLINKSNSKREVKSN